MSYFVHAQILVSKVNLCLSEKNLTSRIKLFS